MIQYSNHAINSAVLIETSVLGIPYSGTEHDIRTNSECATQCIEPFRWTQKIIGSYAN